MPMSFLDVITRGEREGTTLFPRWVSAPLPEQFMFATGIECSNPTIANGRIRRDQLLECGHYEHWQRDLQLVKGLGLTFLRYGLPYHLVHVGPGRYDWSFADAVMAEMRALGIEPILDLLHFGVPDWIGNFQNPELPRYFAEYAAAVAERYSWVRYWTPVNEIYVSARMSTLDGLWNEQIRHRPGVRDGAEALDGGEQAGLRRDRAGAAGCGDRATARVRRSSMRRGCCRRRRSGLRTSSGSSRSTCCSRGRNAWRWGFTCWKTA